MEKLGLKKIQRAPKTIKRSHRFALAGVIAALGLGVTSAYAWHGSLSVTPTTCGSTGGAVTFSGAVTDASSPSWEVSVTGPTSTTTTSTPLGQNTSTGAYQVTVNHLLNGSYSAKLRSVDSNTGTNSTTEHKVNPVTFQVSCGSLPQVPAATPELGSGELLAAGLLPIGTVLLYRRRRARRAGQGAAAMRDA